MAQSAQSAEGDLLNQLHKEADAPAGRAELWWVELETKVKQRFVKISQS